MNHRANTEGKERYLMSDANGVRTTAAVKEESNVGEHAGI